MTETTATFAPLPAPAQVVDARTLADLRARYAEPHRGYHTWEHIEELGATLAEAHAAHPFGSPRAIVLAALFHDAVLVPLANDNEENSARLAERVLGSTDVDARLVGRLIRLTARHGDLDPADLGPDEARFLDADMAILAASPARFEAYEAGVAFEYRSIPSELFRAGRRGFLAGLAARQAIYSSAFFRERLEARARENITAALADDRGDEPHAG
jgi:predicted metal-dependent HD superfamily phosphohydrolase